MKLPIYQVDAFAVRPFEGNPAAICPLDSWLDDSILQAIAEENNLSETAFFVRSGESYDLRWFTPVSEVDLCGHATLASAHVLFQHLGYSGNTIHFRTRSGELAVTQKNGLLEMDFPVVHSQRCTPPQDLLAGLGAEPVEILAGDDYLVVLADEETVRNLKPDLYLLSKIDLRGVIVSARGTSFDFVSRAFFPKLGIPEDPVTGSAHCQLTPYWAGTLGKNTFKAAQISKRGGCVNCKLKNGRVLLSGSAVTYMTGEITFDM